MEFPCCGAARDDICKGLRFWITNAQLIAAIGIIPIRVIDCAFQDDVIPKALHRRFLRIDVWRLRDLCLRLHASLVSRERRLKIPRARGLVRTTSGRRGALGMT